MSETTQRTLTPRGSKTHCKRQETKRAQKETEKVSVVLVQPLGKEWLAHLTHDAREHPEWMAHLLRSFCASYGQLEKDTWGPHPQHLHHRHRRYLPAWPQQGMQGRQGLRHHDVPSAKAQTSRMRPQSKHKYCCRLDVQLLFWTAEEDKLASEICSAMSVVEGTRYENDHSLPNTMPALGSIPGTSAIEKVPAWKTSGPVRGCIGCGCSSQGNATPLIDLPRE